MGLALKVVVGMGLLVALAAGITAFVDEDRAVRRVAALEDLLSPVSEGEAASQSRFYAVPLPGTPLVVILRPIPREEYFSYQVKAIAYEMIEQEMLAAAIVLPDVDAGHVAQFPDSLLAFLQREVNGLSGYNVFATP